jgi:hypothetical protein
MKRLQRVWLFPVLAVLLPVAGTSCNRMGARSRIDDQLEAIRKAGQPVTLAELDKWYQDPTPEENAAPLLEKSFELLQLSEADTASLPILGREKNLEMGGPLPPAMRRRIAQLISTNQPALTALHQAATRKYCRFPIVTNEGGEIILPHLPKLRTSAKLLELEALFNADSSNSIAAVQAMATSFRLAHLLDQDPFVISQLVRNAIDNATCSSLERTLNTVPLSDDQLAALLSVVQEGENSPGMARGLIGDRCLSMALLRMPPKERETLVVRSVKGQGGESTKESSWDEDFAFFLQSMDEAITTSKLPFPQALQGGQKMSVRAAEAKRKNYLYSATTLVSIGRLFAKHGQHEARLRCAEAGLGVQRFRLAHQNKLPSSLEETVPAILKAVPADPFDGTPLQYRRESAIRFTVSSSTDDPKTDLVFKVMW